DYRYSVAGSGGQSGGVRGTQADAGAACQGDERSRRAGPRNDAAEARRQGVPGDSENHGGGGDQYHLHLGSPLPQEPAGGHGRELGAAQTMSPEDIKKLLGGYATGTLTAEERQGLFAAALEDQEMFDAV